MHYPSVYFSQSGSWHRWAIVYLAQLNPLIVPVLNEGEWNLFMHNFWMIPTCGVRGHVIVWKISFYVLFCMCFCCRMKIFLLLYTFYPIIEVFFLSWRFTGRAGYTCIFLRSILNLRCVTNEQNSILFLWERSCS